MISETLTECKTCKGYGSNVYNVECPDCKGDGAVVIRQGLPNGRIEHVSWSESVGLKGPEQKASLCTHGYGGFFKCPKGCHSQGPIQDHEDREVDINYFLNRLEAHG